METINATNARQTLFSLIDQVNETSEPATIVGKRGSAVLVGEDDWRALQETIYLASIPGMTQSLQEARREPLDQGSRALDW